MLMLMLMLVGVCFCTLSYFLLLAAFLIVFLLSTYVWSFSFFFNRLFMSLVPFSFFFMSHELYNMQRWVYRVDHSRANEFGQSGEDEGGEEGGGEKEEVKGEEGKSEKPKVGTADIGDGSLESKIAPTSTSTSITTSTSTSTHSGGAHKSVRIASDPTTSELTRDDISHSGHNSGLNGTGGTHDNPGNTTNLIKTVISALTYQRLRLQ
jgi:hypothetical protein